MDKLLTLTVSGAVSGAIYSLVAACLVLTYTSSGIFNFAYGAIAFTGGFLFYELNVGLHWHPFIAAAFCLFVFAPVLGLSMNRLVFRRLVGADDSARIVAAVGLSVAIPALALWVVELGTGTFNWEIPTGENIFGPPGIGPVPAHGFRLFGRVNLTSNQLIVVAAALVGALVLWIILRRTRLGLVMRAAVDRPQLAELRGISVNRTSGAAWMLSCVLAVLAGIVGAPIFNNLAPGTYTLVLFVAAAAAIVGGLKSIPLAFVAGLGLGIAQNLVAGYSGSLGSTLPGFNSSVPFLIMFGALVFLTKRRGRIAGSRASVDLTPDYWADLPAWRRRLPWVIAMAVFIVWIEWLASDFWAGLGAKATVYALIFLSFTIVTGLGRLVSLAQATFVTGAGLMTGLLLSHGMPFVIAAIAGIGFAVGLGILVALPSLRLGGLFFALATLALAFLGDRVLYAWNAVGGGSAGWQVARPSLFGFGLESDRRFALVVLAFIGLICLMIRALTHSASGRAIVAVSLAEAAAVCSGVSPRRTKVGLFAVSAAVAGLGGVLLAVFNRNANSTGNPATAGLLWLAAVVLFGIRRSAGAVLAGFFFVVFPQIVNGGVHLPESLPSWLGWNGTSSVLIPQILFGLGAIQLAQNPYGILAIVAKGNYERRHRATAAAVAERVSATEDRFEALEAQTGTPRTSLVAPSHSIPLGDEEVAALSVRSLRAGYGNATVLHGVDLVVPEGSIVGILGPNGAGKSTMVAVIAGSVEALDGEVSIFGRQVTGAGPVARGRHGLVVVPESRGIFPKLTVEDNLCIWLRDGADRAAVYERFPALAERRRIEAGNLSGGEQQILALAPFFARRPRILIVDEPTLGLAPRVVEVVVGLLSELRAAGTTVVVVEEKSKQVLSIADYVVFMDVGRIVWSGPSSALDTDTLSSMYFGKAGAR
jgi:ABC-type branched-subunit amino acid transport system ATPase component/branched-subunit amino acid ABC-type transport system permease component